MDAYVLVLQNRDGRHLFYAPSQTPPWTDNLLAAGQYTRRYEAETDARTASAQVISWTEAWTLTDDGPT